MAKRKIDRSTIKNKKAYFDYFISDKHEVGIVLEGSEVKSIRAGNANLKDSYVRIKGNEAFLINMHISPYEMTTDKFIDPVRSRKLLMHKYEIIKLASKASQKGYTIVPLKLYFKRGYVKLEIGLGKGKHNFDKRDSLKKKSQAREIAAALRYRG